MRITLRQVAAAGTMLLALSAPFAARADDDGDHDRARELREHGEIRALHDILRIVQERVPGDIVSVDLIRPDGKWIYRFQVVDSVGRRTTVDVDAGAAKVLRHGDDDR